MARIMKIVSALSVLVLLLLMLALVATLSEGEPPAPNNEPSIREEATPTLPPPEHLIATADVSRNETPPNQTVTEEAQVIRKVGENLLDRAVLDEFFKKKSVAEYEVVTVDADSIREYIRNSNGRKDLQIALIDDYSVAIAPNRSDEYSSGWQSGISTLSGRVAGVTESFATILVSPDGSIRATISVPGRWYRIESSGQLPYHVVWRMADDQEQQPQE